MSNISSIHPDSVRSIWISDTHLGFRGCQAELLLNFLHSVQSENLFLVGDIIDCWSLTRNFHWPQTHNNILRTILGKAKHGTKVVYVPGNHDELFREYCGHVFGNVEIHREYIHTTANGRRLLILHGDEFDHIVTHSRLLADIGSHAYDLLLRLNVYVHYFRKLFNFPYWSLAAHLKHKVKNAVKYISNFEEAITNVAVSKKVDGIVCVYRFWCRLVKRSSFGRGIPPFARGRVSRSHGGRMDRPDGRRGLGRADGVQVAR